MRALLCTILAAGLLAAPLAAQLRVPGGAVALPPVSEVADILGDEVDAATGLPAARVTREARRLLRERDRMVKRLLQEHRALIEPDADGAPARRGELLALGLNEAEAQQLREVGFAIAEREDIEGLDLSVTRLAVPEGIGLASAQAIARTLAPAAEISADHLHFRAGAAQKSTTAAVAVPAIMARAANAGRETVTVGVIDGGAATSAGLLAQKGFAKGAPLASDHGTAIVGLLRSAGATRLQIADVYGNDPAGGNALALARALGWHAASGSRVVNISLVGPRNAVVERAIAAAQRKGMIVVAPVGNDGPASALAYPASYDGVVSVTGIDRKGRALIEAGRARDLDYAAPGAGVWSPDVRGRPRAWRGTSFAAPLAAARIARAIARGSDWRPYLDREARDLGQQGPDPVFGRGALCMGCARKK